MNSKITPMTQNRVLLALASLALAALTAIVLGAQTPGEPNRVRHTIIAASGGAAPVGGNYITFLFVTPR